MKNLFENTEKKITEKFDDQLAKPLSIAISLLEHLKMLVYQLNNKYMPENRPEYTIELLLSSDLTILNNSLQNLRRGYLPASQSLLRTTMENLIFAMYFFEFPEHEKKYRDNPKGLASSLKAKNYNQEWIEAHLARVDKEGTKFSKLEGESNIWQNRIFRNIVKECSNYVHMNFFYLETSLFGVQYADSSAYIIGPNWINDNVMENGTWKIIEATLMAISVFDRVFHDYTKDVQDMKLFIESTDALNEWKKNYPRKP